MNARKSSPRPALLHPNGAESLNGGTQSSPCTVALHRLSSTSVSSSIRTSTLSIMSNTCSAECRAWNHAVQIRGGSHVRSEARRRLTSTWDSDVALGSVSSPTVTESRGSSVGEHERTSGAECLPNGTTSRDGCPTLCAARLGLRGVVQLHLVVSSGHVHPNAQRL